MAIRVQNNIASLTANKHLSRTATMLSQSLERLSSGFRINRAADDAAGLSISQKFRAQIASLKAASRNATEANSLLQVAEGGMEEVHNMLTRLKELATQAASANSEGNRTEINAEAQALLSEISRISTATEYNGNPLLTGYGTKTFSDAFYTKTQNVYDVDVTGASVGSYSFSYDLLTSTLSLSDGTLTETAELVTNSKINFGSLGVSFKVTAGLESLGALGESLAAIDGTGGADFSVSGSDVQFQIGDSNDSDKQLSFSINSITTNALSISSLTLATISGSQEALGTIDTAIDVVNTARGTIGANMNRLSYASATLQTAVENLTASESVIRDVDMAFEMSTFTKHQILQQAGVSMLAQANSIPQSVLSLLGG